MGLGGFVGVYLGGEQRSQNSEKWRQQGIRQGNKRTLIHPSAESMMSPFLIIIPFTSNKNRTVSIRILIFFSFLTLKHHPHESSVLSLPPTPLKAFSRSKRRVTSFCGKKNYAASAMCLVGCIEKQWSQLFAGKKPDLLYHLLGVLLRTSKKKETQPLIPSSLTSLYSALPPPTRHLILSLSHLPPLSVFSSPSLSVLMPGTLLSVVFNIWFVLGLELTQNTNRIN